MRKAGFDSYITSPGNPEWNSPVFSGSVTESDIVIYPEVEWDRNPLGIKNVVRYILYFPKCKIPAAEYCMPFHEYLFDSCCQSYMGQLTKDNILLIPGIEPNLFEKGSNKSIDSCYFVGKGLSNYPSCHLPGNSIEINAGSPATRIGLADLLKKTKVFYSFDHQTALCTEAALCGCEVLLMNGYNPPSKPILYPGEPEIHVMNETKDIDTVRQAAERIIRFFNL
jgi:hypothetical protein